MGRDNDPDEMGDRMTTYTTISDYVLDQVVAYQTINALKNNVRYLEEDILGDPSTNSDLIDLLTMDGTATDGGAIYFAGGSSVYIKADSTGAYVEFTGQNTYLASTKTLIGSRHFITWVGAGNVTAAQYINNETTVATDVGYIMPRAGSIISVTAMMRQSGAGTNVTATAQIRKNGSNVLESSSIVFSGDGKQTTYTTQARDTDTFVAGDRLSAYFNLTAGTKTINLSVAAEVVFDT